MSPQSSFNFDVDHYLNRFVPPNRLDVLPPSIARFLGHRRQDQEKPVGNVLVWFWACLGAFCGILVVEAVYSAPLLRGNGAPVVIGSLVYFFRKHFWYMVRLNGDRVLRRSSSITQSTLRYHNPEMLFLVNFSLPLSECRYPNCSSMHPTMITFESSEVPWPLVCRPLSWDLRRPYIRRLELQHY